MRLLAIGVAGLTACGPSDGQLCSRICGDNATCMVGSGFDYNACQDGCATSLDTDEVYRAYVECIYASDGTCMTGYPECPHPDAQ